MLATIILGFEIRQRRPGGGKDVDKEGVRRGSGGGVGFRYSFSYAKSRSSSFRFQLTPKRAVPALRAAARFIPYGVRAAAATVIRIRNEAWVFGNG